MPQVVPNGYRAIDTLCGAGGMTLAQHLAGFQVSAALNHWQLALDSQAVHFPGTPHFCADVRTQHADALGQADYFHMSPDCRHHSRAKGGKPVDPSVRALAEEAPRYLLACDAKIASFENVPEFVEWGPEVEVNGEWVRDKTRLGEHYQRWVATLRAMGYVNHEWRVLNSADYGSAQARRRYFGLFSRAGIPISWPPKTHDEHGRGGLPRWRGAIEILEPSNYGKSVFGGKQFVEATLLRLAAGVEKFGGQAAPWLLKYNSNRPDNKPNPGYASYRPLNTLACQRREAVVRPVMLHPYYAQGACRPVNKPAATITCQIQHSAVSAVTVPLLLHPYYKSGKCIPLGRSLQTLTTKDRFGVASAVLPTLLTKSKFAVASAVVPAPGFSFCHQFGNGARSVGSPLRTLLASRRHHYLGFFHYWGQKPQQSPLGRPLPTIVTNPHARLLTGLYAPGQPGEKVADDPDDTPGMRALKVACRKWGIIDLLVRMLTVRESLRGQGFPDWYTLLGTETDQRKMIGNAVEVNTGLAVASEVRRMLDRYHVKPRTLAPLKLRPVLRWEQGELFGKGVACV